MSKVEMSISGSNVVANVDFSAVNYMVRVHGNSYIELIPDSLGFLETITDQLPPFSDYDVKIVQSLPAYHHCVEVTLEINCEGKEYSDTPLLSEKDYEYFRNILAKGAPKYRWATADEVIRNDLRLYVEETPVRELLKKSVCNLFVDMILERYPDIKKRGVIDFDEKRICSVVKEILDNSQTREEAYKKGFDDAVKRYVEYEIKNGLTAEDAEAKAKAVFGNV